MQPEFFAHGTLFSRIFHASPVAMAVTIPDDGRFVDVNAAFSKLVGCQREEIIGIQPQRNPQTNSSLPSIHNKSLAFLHPVTERSIRILANDKTARDVIITSQIMQWEGHSRLFTLLQDLTDYYRTQIELNLSEARFKLFFDSIPLPVFVFDYETLQIIDANVAAIDQYGFSREELLSVTMLDIRPPSGHSAFLDTLHLITDAGQLNSIRQHWWKDGTVRDVDIFSYSLKLAGRKICLNVVHDITERLARQKALEASEERLSIIAEVTTDAIWEVDFQTGEVNFSNGLDALFGYDSSEVLDLEWWSSHIHPDEQDTILEGFNRAINEGETQWESQYRFCRADGVYAHVIDRGVILRNDQGLPVRMIGTMVDITRQVEIKEAATLATQEERRRLARDLHDAVTQSLYSLTLMAEAARRRVEAGELDASNEYMDRLSELAQQSLKEMRLLVYELSPAALEKNSLADAIEARLDAVERRAGVQATLEVTMAHNLPPDIQSHLYRIVEEALNNTLKHAQASTVNIKILSNDQATFLQISDNGKGFEYSNAISSGGLGLANIQERAAKIGAQLVLESEVGKGTAIYLTLKPMGDDHGS